MIPLITAVLVGYLFSQPIYSVEIANGSDDVDAFRWTAIGFFIYGFFGSIFGLVLDLFIWLIGTPPKVKKEVRDKNSTQKSQ